MKKLRNDHFCSFRSFLRGCPARGAVAKGETTATWGTALPCLSRRALANRAQRVPNRCFRHENRDISAEGPYIPSMTITHPAQRHTAHKCNQPGHIFLEAEETDISSAGRSSGSGSPRYAPSRLVPMAFCASLAHTAAVLPGIFTPFPFDPADAGTRRFPDIQFISMIPQKSHFVKGCFLQNAADDFYMSYHSAHPDKLGFVWEEFHMGNGKWENELAESP